jgi:death on curing protein
MTDAREPRWLDLELVVEAHDLTIARHGGLPGVRDVAALESALARPKNKWAYGEEDLFALASAYGFGLARNHAFSDGNKRIAAISVFLFLGQNGFWVPRDTPAVIATFLALAAGDLSEDQLADWLRERARPV